MTHKIILVDIFQDLDFVIKLIKVVNSVINKILIKILKMVNHIILEFMKDNENFLLEIYKKYGKTNLKEFDSL